MATTSETRNGPTGIAVDPLVLVAGGLGLLALVLLGVGVHAALSSLGVTLAPSAAAVSALASTALFAVAVAVSLYGKRRNGRRRPRVRYGR